MGRQHASSVRERRGANAHADSSAFAAEDFGMRHAVVRFVSQKVALEELEPFVRNGQQLVTGKPLKRFGAMRPRELLANWLLCAVADTFTVDHRFSFTSDPVGGDGVIIDETTGETWSTEHVFASARPGGGPPVDGDDVVLQRILAKWNKGAAAYAEGKTLVVMAEGIGTWNPTSIARQLPAPLRFDAVWVVALHRGGLDGYHYDVSRLDLTRGAAPIWRVSIAPDFGAWKVATVG